MVTFLLLLLLLLQQPHRSWVRLLVTVATETDFRSVQHTGERGSKTHVLEHWHGSGRRCLNRSFIIMRFNSHICHNFTCISATLDVYAVIGTALMCVWLCVLGG